MGGPHFYANQASLDIFFFSNPTSFYTYLVAADTAANDLSTIDEFSSARCRMPKTMLAGPDAQGEAKQRAVRSFTANSSAVPACGVACVSMSHDDTLRTCAAALPEESGPS